MRTFLERTASGLVHFEDEGWKGFPERTWRKAKKYVPALAKLDFLPLYSLCVLFATLALLILYKLYMLLPDDPGYVPPPPPPQRPLPPAKSARPKKVD